MIRIKFTKGRKGSRTCWIDFGSGLFRLWLSHTPYFQKEEEGDWHSHIGFGLSLNSDCFIAEFANFNLQFDYNIII